MKSYFFIVYIFLVIPFSLFSKNVEIHPEPNWVKSNEPNLDDTKLDLNSEGGFYYLLVDFQDNVFEETKYGHLAYKVINNEGIQQLSDISIDFDPNYQKLIFHKLVIHRNNKKINQLDINKINTLQRETNMERHIYDEAMQAIINLTDVREGDVIEYSYSLIGYNPIHKGNYFSNYYHQYSFPIEKIFTRIISPNELQVKQFNGEVNLKKYKYKNGLEYIWESNGCKALICDKNIPYWYDPYLRIQTTTFTDWKTLVAWILPEYKVSQHDFNLLKTKLNEIDETIRSKSNPIKLIQFIQDEFRYLGFEGGLNSYKPHSPVKVFNQRFGDCKDKSLLLSSLLKLIGIESYPMLVNSSESPELNTLLPSPLCFNHCVVYFKHDNKDCFVDPTISNQGGTIENYYFPDYKYGLILKENENRLTEIPFKNNSKTIIEETFDMESVGSSADLTIITKYQGKDADYQRNYFSRNSIKSIDKDYLDFYSFMYPDIKTKKSIELNDNREENTITVKEFYTIDSIWYADSEYLIVSEFIPLMIRYYIDVPNTPERTMPYQLNFPINLSHKTTINLPEKWSIETTSKNISNDIFSYSFKNHYKNKTLNLNYDYEVFKDYLKPDEVKNFVKDHDDILNKLSYSLTYSTALGSNFQFSWLMGLLAVVICIFCFHYARKIYFNYNVPKNSTMAEGEGIGGWLVLIAIGLCITPIFIAYQIIGTPEYFDRSVWVTLIQNNDTQSNITAIVMIIELIYNIALWSFIVLLAILFFKRRTIVPNLMIVYLIAPIIFIILDNLAVMHLVPESFTDADKSKFYSTLAREVIVAAIWIPYFLMSERVKDTFVKEIVITKDKKFF